MNQNQQFVNPAFAEIYEGITARMPSITFYGVIVTYAVTAALNVYFIPLPLYISIPAALALQFGRFAIVFMDFLNPTGIRTPWPPLIAAIATIIALTELGFSCQDIGFTGPKFWAVFLFGSSVISFGYLLEVNFIAKGAEAFGMGSRHKPQGIQAQQPAQQAAAPTLPAQQQPISFQWPKPQPNGNGVHHHNGATNSATVVAGFDPAQRRLQQVATDDNTQRQQIDLVMIERSLRNAKSNLAAWENKKRIGAGTTATNNRNISYWKKQVDQYNHLLTATTQQA